jgi:hypothetical protein
MGRLAERVGQSSEGTSPATRFLRTPDCPLRPLEADSPGESVISCSLHAPLEDCGAKLRPASSVNMHRGIRRLLLPHFITRSVMATFPEGE